MKRLDGKHALITGATGGQGAVACRRFCAEGATVVGSDIGEETGRALEEELRAAGHQFTFIQADLTAPGQTKVLADEIAEILGHVDVLYNNHGILKAQPLLETTDELWDLVQNTDLKSVFCLTRDIAPLMRQSAAGSVINVGSIASMVALPNMAAYCAAKTGLIGLTRGSAVDLAADGIRVNAICPGVIDTPMARSVAGAAPDPEDAWRQYAAAHVLDRCGAPEEIVAVAVFLASDESAFMTGASIAVDGGWSVQ